VSGETDNEGGIKANSPSQTGFTCVGDIRLRVLSRKKNSDQNPRKVKATGTQEGLKSCMKTFCPIPEPPPPPPTRIPNLRLDSGRNSRESWAMRFIPIRSALLRFGLTSTFLALAGTAQAGVMNLPNFQEVGAWSLGVEPEITLTNGAGLAGTAKFTYGLNELSNLQVGVGHGSGPRQFRLGGALTFDFLPDLESQPGVGVAVSAYYFRAGTVGQIELSAIPYIHKQFDTGSGKVDPFLAIPVGFAFKDNSRYISISQAAVGASFHTNELFRYTVELGLAINNTDSYISAGITYTP
jgi:hypothetical protein